MRLTLALQPPDPLTPERFALWATRLGHLVDSGDITEQQAGDAVDRTARLLERTTA
jgi:hypothetical protein